MKATANSNGNLTSGTNLSYWLDSVKPSSFESISSDQSTEILIIGAGIAGLTTAYCLAASGRKVIVVEDGMIGSGESGRTTAHFVNSVDDRYYHIEKMHGEEISRLVAESHTSAINWVERTIKHENIECHFRRLNGYLFMHPSDKATSLQKEYDAARRAGIMVDMLARVPDINDEQGQCIRFPEQAQLHIMLYLNGLANAIVNKGGKICTNSRAADIGKKGAKVNGCTIDADHIVVATNTPVNDMVTMHTKQFPYRSYVIGGLVPKDSIPFSLWWDTGNLKTPWVTDPYHYIRLEEYDAEFDLLISGGEDHKTGQANEEKIPEEDRYNKLIQWTRKRFPLMGDIKYQWSGQVMEPLDSLAFIGKNPGDDNIYIITGDSGNGMTHCTIGGMIIKDLVNGKKNPWAELYSPSRIPFKAADDYIKEVANMVAQYGDWLDAEDIADARHLKPGEGAILTSGLKPLAVYCDDENTLHAHSAVCPHLGCILRWNADEKTFDCPCHGSRFTNMGVVINGPALTDLKKFDIKQE